MTQELDDNGRPIASGAGVKGSAVSGVNSCTDGSNTTVIMAQGAGVKVYLTDVSIVNNSGTEVYVELKSNTTVKWTLPVPAHGGVTHSFATPIPGTANMDWNFDPSSAATTIICSLAGFTSNQ